MCETSNYEFKLPMHFSTACDDNQQCVSTGGNKYLKEAYGCTIVGPRADADRIPLMDQAVGDGDVVNVGNLELQVFDTPGEGLRCKIMLNQCWALMRLQSG